MPDLRHRSQAAEWMDGAEVTPEDFAACVKDLAAVNTVTLARGPTLRFVTEAVRQAPRTPTILDVGFGAGDMLRAIAEVLRARGLSARLVGIDLNPRSEPVARSLTPPDASIEWCTGDAYAWAERERPDLIISSLVTHHMDDAEVVRFCTWMEATAGLGWFVNDLHRHALPWYGFTALAALARWHPFVRHDGPLSIARSFRRDEWHALLRQAGVDRAASVRWRFPFRYCVERRRW
ncbi:SAM-dependent methyltransferase [Novosphingobium chloroacetimidivorans]|uniref:SAM-dependent methyltransferase n=1 Tax=Novosphingobium chloroacetimidivorans TaxID=1428314 RepID=A0A7W7K936_9SPHN|nr:methyltransferase domain-containing protein [Novosphingobium chloroacetimidivorans]MBB4858497.1 SAM-dependent methyltransferase [Novosphingobium chloroacetimidivorans]